MKDNIVKVLLWGKEICKLQWVGGYKQGFGKLGAKVSFHPSYSSLDWNLDPLGLFSTGHFFVQKGMSDICRGSEYEGIPRFISGSLPDEWGNAVFGAWAENNHLKHSQITAVDKLAFIGARGMGALEFKPSLYTAASPESVALEELREVALSIQKSRESVSVNLNDNPGINDLMAVGMSAGGMHPKAIIAIDHSSGEVRSGQILLPERFTQYILKFKDSAVWPTAELEYVYYLMATKAGIVMEKCSMLDISGEKHFLTERFDRKNGGKLHTATLQALNGKTEAYEDIFSVCRQLSVPYQEQEQLFRRAVFETVCGVCDNHDKNFSFLMAADGKWHLAPAYDLTFSVNLRNKFIGDRHYMTISGLDRNVGKKDLIALAENNDIRNASGIISAVCEAAGSFESLAQENHIDATVSGIVLDYIKTHLL